MGLVTAHMEKAVTLAVISSNQMQTSPLTHKAVLSVVKSQGKAHWWVSDYSEWEKRNKSLQHMRSRSGAPSLRWNRPDSPQTGLTRSQSRREAVEGRGCAVNAGGIDRDARRQQYLGEEDLAVWISHLAHESWQVLKGSWMLPIYDISEDSAWL